MHVVVHVGPEYDLYHTSLILTGLCGLADAGQITLRYQLAAGDAAWLAADPVVVCADLRAGESSRRIAMDLRDGLGISRPIIDRVDVYYKRAYHRPEVESLPPQLAKKLRPFGLNYGCRSGSSTVRLLRAIGWLLLRKRSAGLHRLRQYLTTPPPSAFEQSPDASVEAKVVFQTRLWTAAEIPPDEVEPLNQGRVAMVRALRHAFGDRFIGGLVPTPLAVERYPGDVTRHSSRYIEYLRVKKRCLVSVYTRGVEHSLAFKLGETIAASQCLVSVPLRYELPSPLVEERNYLPFETVDEAVTACERLLTDQELARAMRHANFAYYRQEVEPATHAHNIIRRSNVAPSP